jgi:DeoR/GlpR family transcriptional regulator of sugar metabolism
MRELAGGLSGDERRERLLALVTQGNNRADALAAELGVTVSTIRRDLGRLVSEGRVVRTYGGAVTGLQPVSEPALAERARLNRAAKEAIGRLAATLVADDQTLLLDAGTTVARLAAALRGKSGLTVVTSGLSAAEELEPVPGVELYLLGGRVRRISHGLVGPLAEAALRRISADLVFLGADGLHPRRGICEATLEQTHLKELMASAADRVVVLADASKLGATPFEAWAPLETPWTLVTDSSAPPAVLEQFRSAGATVLVAEVPGSVEVGA